MANLGISLKIAKAAAARDMSRPVKALGFEETQIGPHIVNILFYSYKIHISTSAKSLTYYRADFYVNGVRTNGIALD